MTQLFTRVIALIGFAMSIAERAVAQSQPDTNRMTCGAAQALVMKRGEIVLGTGPSLFDRYVSSRASCTSTELTEPTFVPTTDNRQCFAGYRCKQYVVAPDRWSYFTCSQQSVSVVIIRTKIISQSCECAIGARTDIAIKERGARVQQFPHTS